MDSEAAHLFWNIAAQMAKALISAIPRDSTTHVCDLFSPSILDITQATAADRPVIKTKLGSLAKCSGRRARLNIAYPRGIIHISLSLAGVNEKATYRHLASVPRFQQLSTYLRKQQSWGEERDIDNVQFTLSRLVGDSSSREDVSSDT